jgi:hypothetical protein
VVNLCRTSLAQSGKINFWGPKSLNFFSALHGLHGLATDIFRENYEENTLLVEKKLQNPLESSGAIFVWGGGGRKIATA